MYEAQDRPTRLARLVAPLAVGALTVAPLAAAGIAATPAYAAATKIDIKGFAYSNPALKISVGDKVTWTNRDDAPHDAAAKTGPELFKSPILKKGESWAFTFTKAGAYSYICSVHPQMTASVTVAEADAAAPAAVPVVEPAAPEPAAPAKTVEKPAGAKLATKPAAAKPTAAKAAPAKPTAAKPTAAKPAVETPAAVKAEPTAVKPAAVTKPAKVKAAALPAEPAKAKAAVPAAQQPPEATGTAEAPPTVQAAAVGDVSSLDPWLVTLVTVLGVALLVATMRVTMPARASNGRG